MRKVALGSTFYFYFSTRRFSTGASYTLAGTPAIHAYEDNSDTQITSGITISADADSVTGLNRVTVVATAANGYEAGKHYTFTIGAGTVDSVSVVGTVVYECMVETAAELAQRQFAEKMYPNHVVATTTGNTTSAINLTEIVDAQTTADALNGEVLTVCDITDDTIIQVRVTDFATSNLLATVEQLDGTAMPFTVAAGDMVWRTGQYTADVHRWNNTAVGAATAGVPNVNVTRINNVAVTGAGTSGDKWRA